MTVIIRDEKGNEVKVNNQEMVSSQINLRTYKFSVVREHEDKPNEEIWCEVVPGKQYVDLQRVWDLLKDESWWRGAVIERFMTAVMNSKCYSLYVHEETTGIDEDGIQYETTKATQVGFARVVTDYATFAYIDDVVVDPEYRGLGLGEAINRAIIEDPDLQTFRRWFLIACDKVESLYERVGFKRLANPEIYMEVYNGDAYMKDAENLAAVQGKQ